MTELMLKLAAFLAMGIDHAAAHTAALDLAVEDVCLSRMQDVFAVFLVEEGYIQHAALVHGPYLHQRLSAADTGAWRSWPCSRRTPPPVGPGWGRAANGLPIGGDSRRSGRPG